MPFKVDFYLVVFLCSSVTASRAHLVFHGQLKYPLKVHPTITNYLLITQAVLGYVSLDALLNI